MASEILDVKRSFAEELPQKLHHHTPVASFAPQVRKNRVKSSVGRVEHGSSHSRVLEISGFQVGAFALVFLFAVIGLTVGLTVGRGPLGKRLRDVQESMLAVDTTSPALPNRPGEATSQASTLPAANTFNTPAVNPSAPEAEESRSESPSAQSLKGLPEDTAIHASPTGPASTVASRSLIDSDHSSGTNNLAYVSPFEERPKESTPDSESVAKVASADSNLPPTTESKPSLNAEPTPGRNGSAVLIARSAPPPASPKPAHSPKAVGPIKWCAEKFRHAQGNARGGRSATPVAAFHNSCYCPSLWQETVPGDFPGETDRRLLIVRNDL